MKEALIELVEQLMEFGYGDPVRLESILNRLKTEEDAYPTDRRYVDMLVSKYLYPHVEEDEYAKKSTVGSLEKKIQTAKQRYEGGTTSTNGHLADLCPKCGTLVPLMFSFCSRCGAFHDEHNFIDTRKSMQQKGKLGATQSRQAGLAIVGIIFIILGGISTMFLFGYSNLCSSIVGIFAQIIQQQTQQICSMIQTWYFIGVIVLIIGIILLAVRAAKIRHQKKVTPNKIS